MRIIDIETKQIFSIEFTGHGTELKSTCPVCSSSRKKQKDKVLSYNSEKKTAYCHHCNSSFVEYINRGIDKKEYKKPDEWNNKTDLSDNVVKFFEKRNINQDTLKETRISEGVEYMPQFNKEINTIQFNYFLNNELVNIKYRGAKKSFKLFKDGELIFYNLDSIKDTKSCIIVEGEIDCLSFIQIGLKNVISVPNGAGKNTEYLDNYLDYFENKEVIYLATDNDIKGIELRNELARRFGLEKCKKIDFKDCKDANEYHIKFGGESLRQLIKTSKDFKIDGLFNITDIEKEYFSLFNNGLQKGLLIGGLIDEFISFQTGRLYTITGIPNHGKSNWLDFVISILSIKYKLKFGYFSPENQPLQLHAATLTEKIIGKQFDNKKMMVEEVEEAYDYLKENFHFINPPDNFNIDNILNLARILVRKYGIKGIVIDPYNKIEHQIKNGMSETNYISSLLDKLTAFAIKEDIMLFLVAHPTKMKKDSISKLYEVPNLYDINGSANFYNKTDFGITVYRNMNNGQSEIYVQKAKFKHLGGIGFVNQKYNINNGRYSDIDDFENTSFDNSNWLSKGISENKNETTNGIEPDYTELDSMPF